MCHVYQQRIDDEEKNKDKRKNVSKWKKDNENKKMVLKEVFGVNYKSEKLKEDEPAENGIVLPNRPDYKKPKDPYRIGNQLRQL